MCLGTGTLACAIAPYSHWMYHALQMALLRRILSRQSSCCPLKFFHFGDTSFPLQQRVEKELKGTVLGPWAAQPQSGSFADPARPPEPLGSQRGRQRN